MPSVRTRIAPLALLGLVLWLGAPGAWDVRPGRASDFSTCRYFSQLPDDCAGAVQKRFDKLRGYRYEEIDLYARDAIKKVPYVSIYNTTGQNGGDDTRDSAPEAVVASLDPNVVARKYHALRVATTPPLIWTIDWLADRVGTVRNFDGLDAEWMGNRQASDKDLAGRRPSAPKLPAARRHGSRLSADTVASRPAPEGYRPEFIARTSIKGFRKGSEVYLLDDPKGRTWVLVSYNDRNLPGMTLDKLDALGQVLDLPEGWKFRSAKIPKELVLEPKGGSVGRIEDDKGDVYDLAGPGQSNFVP
jgi:hypothetical protein